MSTHEFIVTVDVDDWPESEVAGSDWPERTAEDYARYALYTAGLRDACRLDGTADLTQGSAMITDVTST